MDILEFDADFFMQVSCRTFPRDYVRLIPNSGDADQEGSAQGDREMLRYRINCIQVMVNRG